MTSNTSTLPNSEPICGLLPVLPETKNAINFYLHSKYASIWSRTFFRLLVKVQHTHFSDAAINEYWMTLMALMEADNECASDAKVHAVRYLTSRKARRGSTMGPPPSRASRSRSPPRSPPMTPYRSRSPSSLQDPCLLLFPSKKSLHNYVEQGLFNKTISASTFLHFLNYRLFFPFSQKSKQLFMAQDLKYLQTLSGGRPEPDLERFWQIRELFTPFLSDMSKERPPAAPESDDDQDLHMFMYILSATSSLYV